MGNSQIGTGIVDGKDDAMWEGRYFCYCGAKMKIVATPHVVAESKRIFWREHDGPGHGLCDEKTCDAARIRAEQAEFQGI